MDPEFYELAGANDIAASEESSDIDIEGTIRFGAAQEHADGADALENGVSRGPLVLEEIEANLAGLQGDVGVDDGRDKGHLGGLVRIGGRDADLEEPAAIIIAASDALAVDDGLPLEQITLVDGAKALNAGLLLSLYVPGIEFLDEPLDGTS